VGVLDLVLAYQIFQEFKMFQYYRGHPVGGVTQNCMRWKVDQRPPPVTVPGYLRYLLDQPDTKKYNSMGWEWTGEYAPRPVGLGETMYVLESWKFKGPPECSVSGSGQGQTGKVKGEPCVFFE
jgi:hypothetical protein